MVRSASLLVKMSRSGRVAKRRMRSRTRGTGGRAAGFFRGGSAGVQARGQPGGGQRPVSGEQVIQDGRVQGSLAGEAGGRGGVADLDQQAGHPGRPFLLIRLEVVKAFQVAEQAGPAPGVQGISQVPVSGVSVPDNHPAAGGQS